MSAFIVSARTAAQLSSQIDRFNAANGGACSCNFGRDRSTKLWWAHQSHGRDARTHMAFAELVAYVQRDMDAITAE